MKRISENLRKELETENNMFKIKIIEILKCNN